MYPKSVFQLPLSLQGNKTLIDEGSHVGVDMQIETLYSYLVD